MPRKAGEVLFTPHGRDVNMTSTGPGRGSIALELALEALSWNEDVCFWSQNGFGVAAANTDPLRNPSLKQREPSLNWPSWSTSAHHSPMDLHTARGPSSAGQGGRAAAEIPGATAWRYHPVSFGERKQVRLARLHEQACSAFVV